MHALATILGRSRATCASPAHRSQRCPRRWRRDRGAQMHVRTRLWSLSWVLGSGALALLACSGDGNKDTNARIVSKLKSCGLVRESGKYSDWQPESDEDRCELNC